MSYSIFMTIPGIPGESLNKNFLNAIEVFSFSWAMAETVTNVTSSGGAGKPQFSDLIVNKILDKSSPKLMQALVTGQHLQKVTLSLVKSAIGPSANKPFLTYEFDTVLVSSVQDSGSSGGDSAPSESISFAMERALVTYYTQNPDGSLGASVMFSYNIATNTPV